MAGPRRAEFVSMPIGPGVLSNPTGRGAHTRIAFQNWDRWVDSNWVRWHKMLPEKRGGWAYQALVAATPFAPPDAPIILLHFDGTQGQNTFVDSSVNGTAITANGTIYVDTTNPKIGTGAVDFILGNNAFLQWPTTVNGPLDIDLGDITVEFWAYIRSVGTLSGNEVFFEYSTTNNVQGFRLQSSGFGPAQWNAQGFGAFFMIIPAAPVVLNTWTHIAFVRYGSTQTLYVNGVGTANSTPIPATTSMAVAGSNMSINYDWYNYVQKNWVDGEMDEFAIYKYAKYTANFTPGAAPVPSGILPGTYLGHCRALHDWASIDGQYWVGIGTHLKAYIENGGTLYDITPSRKTSNLSNAITTVVGSPTITIVDNDHRANNGDYITLIGANTVGGLILNGEYPVTVLDPNTYTVTAAANATSNQTGGGNFSVRYDIYPGLPSNGELLGYGTGPYGDNTYGTPRPGGTGVYARLRTWSMDNYGEDLILSPSDGGIYWWQRAYGPSSLAAVLPNAPDGCQRVLVDRERQSLVAFGCTDVTGVYNALLVRWPDINDFTDWAPSAINDAGSIILKGGSRIVTALNGKSQSYCWTDKVMFRVILTGNSNVYDITAVGDCSIVGPNAAADVDGVAMLMGFNNFYSYEGTLQVLNCEVWETVFDPNLQTSLDLTQTEKVYCYTYEPKTEVTWIYPSLAGGGECDRYVTFNWDDQVWYYGSWNRTCAKGRAPAMANLPYSATNGYLYQDETGIDAIEPTGTNAIAFSMRSLDITTGGKQTPTTMGGSDARFLVGGSDSHLTVRTMIPDFAYFTGSMNLTLLGKDRPQETAYTKYGPVAFGPTTTDVYIDAEGSQLVIQLDNLTVSTPSNVIALLALSGANGSTSFPDSMNDLTFTAIGAAAISSANTLFSQNTLLIPDTAQTGADRIVAPLAGTLAANILSNDWTFECFFLVGASGSNHFLFDYGNFNSFSPAGFTVAVHAGNPPYDSIYTESTLGLAQAGASNTVSITTGAWHHFAITKKSGLVTIWLDGVQAGASATWSNSSFTNATPQQITLGQSPAGGAGQAGMNLSEFRITNNQALYTATFTPPASPFPVPVTTPQPSLGTSFRMGIWQALSFPHGRR